MDSSEIGAFVETFLDGEKKAARRLIRHEMESMIDPLVEALFGQLKNKFVDYVDAAKCPESQLVHDNYGQINQETMLFNVQQYQSQSFHKAHSIVANSQINSVNIKPAFMSIKEEINDPSNEFQLEPQLNDDSIINSSSSVHESPSFFSKTMIPLTSTDESFPNTEMQQQQQQSHSQQLVNIKHNQFDDEEKCECEDCVYGEIEIKEEDDDDGSGQLIEDYQEYGVEPSPPLKRPRIDITPNQTNSQTEVTTVRQFPSQPTDEEQQPIEVNDQNKQIITVRLQCPESGCPETFAENELNDHLRDEHLIGPNRCLVKNCKQSFDYAHILSEHIKQHHQGITQWQCGKCAKHFAKYSLLFDHNSQLHQFGQFECAFPSCTFTGEYKAKVKNHYKHQHRKTLNCQQSGCNFHTTSQSHLKTHQRTHSGNRPYRCKWPSCEYAAAQKGDTMKHIRVHIRSDPNGAQLDPNDYFEVMHDLL